MKTAVIGSGTWGMALARLLFDNGHEVKVWSAIESELKELREKCTHKNLPGIVFDEGIVFEFDLEKAMENADICVLSVPSIFTRATAKKMAPFYKENQIIVNVAKGIEESTLEILSDQILDEIKNADVAVLSGPSHAEEVVRLLPTTCVAGAKDMETAKIIQSTFMSPVFRVYTSTDMLGIELGGSLKNVIALAAGISDGLGYGDNAKAALITRGIVEISRLGTAMGANIETFYGLSGIGDLIVTCASKHSRNRKAGMLMGQGMSMDEAMKEVAMVVEGVYSAKAAKALANKYNICMPIVDEVNAVLFENKDPKQAVDALMLRDKAVEKIGI
nr:NAD(P)H-dependent glycerol-3-phosphate dehydrogenase [uncultured Lachnoanaerobaculum sp.]